MKRLARRDQLTRFLVENFVAKPDHATLPIRNARADGQQIIEARRAFVAARRLGHDDEAIVFRFHSRVLKSQLAAQFNTPNFEPNEIVRVVNDAHLVRLGVAYANRRVGVIEH